MPAFTQPQGWPSYLTSPFPPPQPSTLLLTLVRTTGPVMSSLLLMPLHGLASIHLASLTAHLPRTLYADVVGNLFPFPGRILPHPILDACLVHAFSYTWDNNCNRICPPKSFSPCKGRWRQNPRTRQDALTCFPHLHCYST